MHRACTCRTHGCEPSTQPGLVLVPAGTRGMKSCGLPDLTVMELRRSCRAISAVAGLQLTINRTCLHLRTSSVSAFQPCHTVLPVL